MTAPGRVPEKTLRELRDLVGILQGMSCSPVGWDYPALQAALDSALAASKPKRSVKAARARKAEKRQTRKGKTSLIRERVSARANGRCECGCGHEVRQDSFLFAPQLDHFWGGLGRRQEMESVYTCWLLAVRCHEQKTANFPSAERWLEKFIAHANEQALMTADGEYLRAASVAQRRLDSLRFVAQLPHGRTAP